MLKHILYWALVIVVSVALVLGVLLMLESRDAPSLETGGAPPSGESSLVLSVVTRAASAS